MRPRTPFPSTRLSRALQVVKQLLAFISHELSEAGGDND